jgi:oxygen-independent coproporphyrinogen-3 oxidase
MTTHAHLVEAFLAALAFEIDEIGKVFARTGSSLATLYIGGGTPTILSAEQLRALLERLKQKLPLDGLLEYTVEAGRPDTIDREKLKLMRAYGVSRISVNPQTTNAFTLQRIGRQHSIDQFETSVQMVRDLKFPCLNMDMIVGLPNETEADWNQTLQQLLAIQGENITLHTLAPKRAASWDFSQIKQQIAEKRVASWMQVARTELSANGYYPYYLYRQRRSIAGQENCGYTLPGLEGIYNIIMMEERSTVLGLGGGGISKWFDPFQQGVSRTPNPKCPATYSGRIKELVAKKVSKLLTVVN